MIRSPLVGVEWLDAHQDDARLRIVDASWHMPNAQRDARAEFLQNHIERAVFFDIDAIANRQTDLPHMLADAESFSSKVGELGITQTDRIVVYDSIGLFSAARVWWNFRIMGASETFVLDGGLPAWQAAGLKTSSRSHLPERAVFSPEPQKVAERTAAEILNLLGPDHPHQIVDVRPADRFSGAAPEPRPGVRSGHMPGGYNLPFPHLIENGRLKDPASLYRAFQAAGIDLARPIVSSCGSGVTAPILNLALEALGKPSLQVYDGSWAEWGASASLPVVSDITD